MLQGDVKLQIAAAGAVYPDGRPQEIRADRRFSRFPYQDGVVGIAGQLVVDTVQITHHGHAGGVTADRGGVDRVACTYRRQASQVLRIDALQAFEANVRDADLDGLEHGDAAPPRD